MVSVTIPRRESITDTQLLDAFAYVNTSFGSKKFSLRAGQHALLSPGHGSAICCSDPTSTFA